MVEKVMKTQADCSVFPDLHKNIQRIEEHLAHQSDIKIQRMKMKDDTSSAMVYIEDLVDNNLLHYALKMLLLIVDSPADLFQQETRLPIHKMQVTKKWADIEQALLNGGSILFVDGWNEVVIFQMEGWSKQTPTEPRSQKSIFGSNQSFVDSISINLSLIRRYIPNKQLTTKELQVGSRASTKLYFIYLEDVMNPNIVKKMEQRIQEIDIDAMNNIGELTEYLESRPYSLFPQTLLIERPDTTAAHIFQGRLAILMDHSPFAIVVPITFFSFFQAVDDYNFRWITSSFIRILRFLSLVVAVCLPALYIAAISYHFEIIPLDLMMSIAVSREEIPFPPFFEALIMEIAIEMIREAGTRLPSPLGQTLGVVGGIVIGEAAVQANIVSNIMVIVVAITAISSYIIPYYELANSIRLVRFPLMVITSLFGMVGFFVGLLILVIHLLSVEMYGVPYGGPVVPIDFKGWKDTFIRLPMWKMINRPKLNQPLQLQRQKSSRKKRDSNEP